MRYEYEPSELEPLISRKRRFASSWESLPGHAVLTTSFRFGSKKHRIYLMKALEVPNSAALVLLLCKETAVI